MHVDNLHEDRQTDKLTEISCCLADVCNGSATNLLLTERKTDKG